MRSVRLLPIVVFAAAALFLLKGLGILTNGGYVLVGTQTSIAQEAAPMGAPEGDAPDLTRSESKAADRANDTLFSEEDAAKSGGEMDARPVVENGVGEKIEIPSSDGGASTEQAVLSRLSERRAELDALEGQLETRMTLVEAAEKRLAERIAGLEALESRINALVEEKKGLDDAQFSGLVGMYETMKPKDAAAIFDQLEMPVLLRVATSMNPRKMAPVLAAMNTARAQELTVKMAIKQSEPALEKPIDDFSNLPQIVGN